MQLGYGKAIASVDFQTAMQNLKEVRIGLEIEHHRRGHYNNNPWNGWPAASENLPRYCSITTRKLELEFGFQEINYRPLHVLFPNLSHLSFTRLGRGF